MLYRYTIHIHSRYILTLFLVAILTIVPKSILRQEALRIKCNNADTPDQYGNYREAHYTTIKHHWFWKIVTVFDKLQCLSSYTGYVMFLEEDHYTTPDFIATALELVELRNEQCLDCDFINMGVYVPKSMERVHVKNAEVFPWVAGDHNMGFVLLQAIEQLFQVFESVVYLYYQH